MTVTTSPAAPRRMLDGTIEISGGIEFGRCGACGGRTSAERVKADELCFVCSTYGPRRRPIRPGVRFRTVDGKVMVVVDRMPERLVVPQTAEGAGDE